jgi:hypothetical protein
MPWMIFFGYPHDLGNLHHWDSCNPLWEIQAEQSLRFKNAAAERLFTGNIESEPFNMPLLIANNGIYQTYGDTIVKRWLSGYYWGFILPGLLEIVRFHKRDNSY